LRLKNTFSIRTSSLGKKKGVLTLKRKEKVYVSNVYGAIIAIISEISQNSINSQIRKK